MGKPCSCVQFIKRCIFLLQVTWEFVSVLQVMWKPVSVIQVIWESISDTAVMCAVSECAIKSEVHMTKLLSPQYQATPEKVSPPLAIQTATNLWYSFVLWWYLYYYVLWSTAHKINPIVHSMWYIVCFAKILCRNVLVYLCSSALGFQETPTLCWYNVIHEYIPITNKLWPAHINILRSVLSIL